MWQAVKLALLTWQNSKFRVGHAFVDFWHAAASKDTALSGSDHWAWVKMVPIPESKYFPALDKCLNGEDILM